MAVTLGTDAYCEASDIQQRLATDSFDSSTTPTVTELETDIIPEIFEEINGVLEAIGIPTPVTTSASKASRILKMVSTKGVSARVLDIRSTPGYSGGTQSREIYDALRDDYKDHLDMLAKKKLSLIDATSSSDELLDVDETHPEGEFRIDENTGEESDPTIDETTKF